MKWVECMGQGRLFQSSCRNLLLFALAIQGITPDSKDIASINALKFLCPVLTEFDQPVEADDLPDDVCEPLLIKADAASREVSDSKHLPFARVASTGERSPGLNPGHGFVCRASTLIPLHGRVCRLSPLIC